MFEQWPSWIARNARVRRTAIKLWRVLLRMQRATFAKAVLVVHGPDDRILVLRSPAGTLELPVKHLDGWVPITTPSKSLFCTTSSTPVVKLRAD